MAEQTTVQIRCAQQTLQSGIVFARFLFVFGFDVDVTRRLDDGGVDVFPRRFASVFKENFQAFGIVGVDERVAGQHFVGAYGRGLIVLLVLVDVRGSKDPPPYEAQYFPHK